MALDIADVIKTLNPNIGVVDNGDGTYRISMEDVNSDEALVALQAIAGAISGTGMTVIIDQTTLGVTNGVARTPADLENSGVKSADALIYTGAAAVYWITVSDVANLAIELNDSTDNSGTDQWAVDIPAGACQHFIFDPPIDFETGIYLDVSTVTCKVTIGYK